MIAHPNPSDLKIVLAHKDSRFHLYTKVKPNTKIQALLEKEDVSVAQLRKAHEAHMETLTHIEAILKKRKLKYKKAYRARLGGLETEATLVITVGGDGTLLEASHWVKNAVILGVNSDPGRSTGSLCVANKDSFESLFDAFLNGELKPTYVPRLQLTLNDMVLNEPVLNDILIAHKNPAATSRFIVQKNGTQQDIRSSGLWVAASAGSTGGILSAGGQVTALDDPRIQLRVREPCASHQNDSQVHEHFLNENEELEIISRMREGKIYLDGPHMTHPFPMGVRLRISAQHSPLALLVSDEMKQRRTHWVAPSQE
ncbi:MAG: hypothetical protein CMH56_10635 [Myxococcales bacterium]|nr:hypothetical protein [Myxococcales bacterium]